MTILEPTFPLQRAVVRKVTRKQVRDACDGQRIIQLRPAPPQQKSLFELYPLEFFDRDHERRFWSVEPTGDYTADCERGRELAFAFLRSCDRTNGWCSLLGGIVSDMVGAGNGKGNGLIIGFMSVIGTAIAAVPS